MKILKNSTAALFITGVSILVLAAPSFGSLLTSDDFSYTGALTDNGWTAHSGAGAKLILSNGSVAALDQSGGSGEDVNRAFTAQGATAVTYAGFDLVLPAGQTVLADAEGLYFAHLKDAGSNYRARTFIMNPAGGGDFAMAINADSSAGSAATPWATDLSFDTTYRIVINWDAASGTSKMWVNPTNEGSTSISHTGTNTGTLIEGFALRQSNDYTGSQLIGNVLVATTFNEALAAIPEPGTLALFGFALGLVAMLRRRG